MPVAGVPWNHRFVVGRPRWAPLARTERSRRNGQNAPFVKRTIKRFWNTQTRTLARRAFGGFLPWERHGVTNPWNTTSAECGSTLVQTVASSLRDPHFSRVSSHPDHPSSLLQREHRGAELRDLRRPHGGLAHCERGIAIGRRRAPRPLVRLSQRRPHLGQ